RMLHYLDGLQVYNKNYQPLTVPAGATDSLHVTFDGSHTGTIYDTVVVEVGTDEHPVRHIPICLFVPPIDSLNFLLVVPVSLAATEHVPFLIVPDRAKSGKGIMTVAGRVAFP